jgi:hypothetical protein
MRQLTNTRSAELYFSFVHFFGIRSQEIGTVTGPDFIFDSVAIALEPQDLEADLVGRSVQEGLWSLRA